MAANRLARANYSGSKLSNRSLSNSPSKTMTVSGANHFDEIEASLTKIDQKLEKGIRRALRMQELQRNKASSQLRKVEEIKNQAVPSIIEEKLLVSA